MNDPRMYTESEVTEVKRKAQAEAIEQCAIEAGERSPEGVSSHTMLGDMWDRRILQLRAEQGAKQPESEKP